MENLKKVLGIVIEGGNIADKIMHEKLGMGAKLMHLMSLTDELFSLPGIQWSQLDDEYKALSAEQKKELIEYVANKFDIQSDKTEATIEKGFAMFLKLESVVKELIELVKEAKKPSA